jgi:type IV pilus assembly protein PilQ
MNSQRIKIVFYILLASLLCAIPYPETQAEDSVGNLIQNLKGGQAGQGDAQGPVVTNPVKVKDVYSHLAKPVETKKYTGKKISLDLQDADVVNVLRLLADVGGVNIVFGSDVSGKVTVNLKDIPWDQALDIVLMTNGLDKVRMGKIIRIARSETITEEANKRLAAMKASDKVEPLVTRIIPINYSDIKTVKDSELIKNILSERGKIDIDARTNTLIVHDIQRSVDQIETLVKRLDTRIPQVLIEARIVEVNDNFEKEFGIQWGVVRGTTDSSKNTQSNIFGGSIGSTAFNGLGVISGDPLLPVSYNVNLPAGQVLDFPGSIGFNLAKFSSDTVTALDVRLSAAEAESLAKVIASPRIMTVDNEKANIVQGVDIPYLSVSQDGTQVQFVQANLELIVTPHVTAENTILLLIETHKDSANFDVAVQGQPGITRNTAETSILLDDGETTVIGGIYETTKEKTSNGIPGLMSLPYVGKFFRYDKTNQVKKELLVFITPKIIR